MRVRFGVSVPSATAFPHRRDLDKLAELIRIIDGSGVELIGTNDTSFIGGGDSAVYNIGLNPANSPSWAHRGSGSAPRAVTSTARSTT